MSIFTNSPITWTPDTVCDSDTFNQEIKEKMDNIDNNLGIVTYSGNYSGAITLAAAQLYDVITIANVIVPSGAKVLIWVDSVISNNDAVKNCNLALIRGVTEIRKSGRVTKDLAANSRVGIALNHIDAPAAATYTYKLQITPRDGTGQIITFDYCYIYILVLKNAT